MNTLIRNLVFVLALTMIGVACDNSSTGPDSESAAVEGRVDNTNSGSQKTLAKQVEGAVVTAARVNSSGELKTIGNAETETDANGRFTLEIDADAAAEAANQIVIVAENNGESAKAFVTAQVEGGSTAKIQPITFESSSETTVYQQVVANGDADIVSKADIEALVNTKVAQDIESNINYAADIAAALAARAEAKAEAYSKEGEERTEEQMNSILQTKTEAMIELESRLNAASSTEEEEAAFNAFLETVAKAEADAKVEATAAAKASESSSRIFLEKSAELSADAQAELRKNAAYFTAFAMESAVEAQMEAANAAESSISSAADAAATLRADIKAMSNASEEEVKGAFEAFNSEIVAIMQNDANVNGELFASANTTINENNGAKATFESSLDVSLSLSILMDAYTQFYSAVRSTVESTFTGASDAEVEAYTQLLILINVAS